MKNITLHSLRFAQIAIIAMTSLVTSCVIDMADKPEPGPATETAFDIVLNVQAPARFSLSSTRALTQAQEEAVDDITVLVFDANNSLADITGGQRLQQSGTSVQFSVIVPRGTVSTPTANLVALANSSDMVAKALGSDPAALAEADRTLESISRKLTTIIDGAMYTEGGTIPMWGEARAVTIKPGKTEVSIKLTRAVARVDIGVGNINISKDQSPPWSWDGMGDNGLPVPFVPTEVYLARPNNIISLIPAPGNVDSDGTVVAPTIDDANAPFSEEQSWSKFRYDLTGKTFSSGEIYLPEATLAPGVPNDEFHASRMALIVGGKYNGSSTTSYYRFDFRSDGSFVDIVRNRLYLFSIKMVDNPGFASLQQAYESPSMMTVELLDWDEGLVEDIYWRDNYLIVSKNPATVAADEGSSLDVAIYTNCDPLEISMGNNVLRVGQSYSTTHFDYLLSKGDDDDYRLAITARAGNISETEGAARKDKWNIRAGGTIRTAFEVSQLWSAPPPKTKFKVNLSSGGFGSAVIVPAESPATPTAPGATPEAEAGEKVTLNATPDANYEFVGWTVLSGEAILTSLSTTQTSFVMPKSDVSIRADFTIKTYPVTVTSGGHGTATPNVDRQAAGQSVTLTATPDEEYEFVGWVVVTGAPLYILPTETPGVGTFNMPSWPVEIRADFRQIQYNVTVEVDGSGTAGANPATSPAGVPVKIKATPADKHNFLGWTVAVGGIELADPKAAETSFIMPKGDVTIRAAFDWTPYNLVVTDDGKGSATATVAGQPAEAKIKPGVTVDLNAEPAEGYEFLKWTVVKGSPADLTATNPGSFTMPEEDVAIRAEFKAIEYPVTFEVVNLSGQPVLGVMGTVAANPTAAWKNSPVGITANVNDGYLFVEWQVMEGGVTLTDAKSAATNFLMGNAPVKIKAVFDWKQYNITVGTTGSGSAGSNAGKAKLGETVTLTATPDDGYELAKWTVVKGNPGTITSSPTDPNVATFIMPAEDVEVKAEFRLVHYNVTYEVVGSGIVTVVPATSPINMPVVITAKPNDKYSFTGWTVLGGGITLTDPKAAETSFLMPGRDVQLRATFEPTPYNIVMTDDGHGKAGATVAGTPAPKATAGTDVDIEALPDSGYEFVKWTVLKGEPANFTATNPGSFTMPEGDVEIKAEFQIIKNDVKFEVVNPQGQPVIGVMGNVVATPNEAIVNTPIGITATALDGYEFIEWQVISGGVTLTDPKAAKTSFLMGGSDVVIRAVFDWKWFYITVIGDSYGTFTTDAAPDNKYHMNDVVTLTALPEPGYEIAKWIVSGTPTPTITAGTTPGTWTFAMPARNIDIRPEFRIKTYPVKIEVVDPSGIDVSGVMGTATASPNDAQENRAVKLTATANAGYEFIGWQVLSNNVTIDSPKSLETSINMPGSEVRLRAVFDWKSYNIAVKGDSNGDVMLNAAGQPVTKAKAGVKLTLTAEPETGYELARWVDENGNITDLPASGATATFTMPAGDVSVRGEFQLIQYKINFEVVGVGTATAADIAGLCTAKANPATQTMMKSVTVTATPDPKFDFMGWEVTSGGVSLADSKALETSFTIYTSDVNLKAKFDWKSYNLTVTDNGLGTATATAGGATASKVKAGVEVALLAKPNADHELARWVVTDANGDAVSVTPDGSDPNKAKFTMPANGVTVRAEFQVIKYKVKFELVGVGTAKTSEVAALCGAEANPAEQEAVQPVTITAKPHAHYDFIGWEVMSGGVKLDNVDAISTNFTMLRSEVVIRAKFDRKLYSITVSNDGHGTASTTAVNYKAKAEETVHLNAIPTIDETNDYMFDKWTAVSGGPIGLAGQLVEPGGTGTGTFTMPESNVEVKANFKVRDYAIEVITDGKGSVTSSASRSIATETIRLEATVPTGYTFFGWTVMEGDAVILRTNPVEFDMPRSNLKIRADFAHIPVEPYLLFIDYNGRLAAGQWIGDGTGPVDPAQGTVTRDNLLYFKYSSILGMTSPMDNGTEWPETLKEGTLFFNPVKAEISSQRANGMINGVFTRSGYGRLPGYEWGIDRITSRGDITADKFNTEFMTLERGLGDACRLIGLNEDEAYAKIVDGTLPQRNSGFRMPSNDMYRSTHVDTSTIKNKTEKAEVGGIVGRWLSATPNVSSFMPLAGNRSRYSDSGSLVHGGRIDGVGDYGIYATSDNMTGADAYLFELYPSDQNDPKTGQPVAGTATYVSIYEKTLGVPIRCVRK
ncbi:MAG: FimB/Mfa2 family fimbrial subunit [Alistipes sp.]|jgi:hypothetical protein|nr:FimB/Mfa2 family fimbrial subunit [Alistipes sp.]